VSGQIADALYSAPFAAALLPVFVFNRHGRACPGHPDHDGTAVRCYRVAEPSPAMTIE
jgi:hypothetical protein